MVSIEEWSHECKHATGAEKRTFETIRSKMGGTFKASCKGAFNKIKKTNALDLRNCQIRDLGPLEAFGHLTHLHLGDNEISDVGPLTNLTNLTYLSLGDNKISDVGPLTNLTNLTNLYLSNNKITYVGPLTNLTNLTSLGLTCNTISDVGPLSNLINLTTLHLLYNKISDVDPLTNLTNLMELYLSYNSITDFSPVAHVRNVYGKDNQKQQDTSVPCSTIVGNSRESPFYGSMGFSDDEEETIFDLIDENNFDELQTVIDGFETKDELKKHFINERCGEDRLNSLKYAISKKNTKAVEIIGGKAKDLVLISAKKLINYMKEVKRMSS